MSRNTLTLSLVFAVVGFVGCLSRTPPPEFFTLRPTAEASVGSPRPELGLTIGPMDFPRYLDRPEIVTRDGAYRLMLSGANRWGGSLKDDILRVMADDLGTLLGTSRVAIYPTAPRFEVDFHVRLDLREFEAVQGGPVTLRLHWEVLAGAGGAVRAVRASHIEQPVASATPQDRVAAQSAALGAVSREIARALVALHAEAP